MYNVVRVGDKEIPMLAMASVDVYYKLIFREDPIALQASEGFDAGTMISFMERMGFVMAKFAECKDRKAMLQLNEEAFLDWLDGLERAEYINALADVQATYDGQALPTAASKKNNAEPSEA